MRESWLCERGSLVLLLAALCVTACGCEALQEAGVPGMEPFIDDTARREEEERHREKFLDQKDPQALKWLLENRIHSGMTVEDVNRIIGEPGEREFSDRWIKNDGDGRYRASDKVYRWGPDNEGRSIYLVFRENLLVNFDSQDYANALLDSY